MIIKDPYTAAYADAVIEALATVAQAEGAPDINSALAALTFAQGYLVAKLDPLKRQAAKTLCIRRLHEVTAEFVSEQVAAGRAN